MPKVDFNLSLPRILRSAGLENYWAVKVPFLTPKHKAARRKFAKNFMDFDWNKVWYPAQLLKNTFWHISGPILR